MERGARLMRLINKRFKTTLLKGASVLLTRNRYSCTTRDLPVDNLSMKAHCQIYPNLQTRLEMSISNTRDGNKCIASGCYLHEKLQVHILALRRCTLGLLVATPSLQIDTLQFAPKYDLSTNKTKNSYPRLAQATTTIENNTRY
jgi:hypothetical protein